MMQDTNAAVTRALVAALGVSNRNGYDVNSLAVPRKAKEVGGHALVHHNGLISDMDHVEHSGLWPLASRPHAA
jgi:UDP-sugar pyrophosphorylase